MFYCNAYASYEKPHVERNHEFIRLVLPKGTAYTEPTPFDGLTQGKVNLTRLSTFAPDFNFPQKNN